MKQTETTILLVAERESRKGKLYESYSSIGGLHKDYENFKDMLLQFLLATNKPCSPCIDRKHRGSSQIQDTAVHSQEMYCSYHK